jgi:phosphoserine phosphatase RsbU/P
MRVIVADDVELTRDLLSSQLRKIGHDVRVAADGRDALAMLEADAPQLLLTDWQMPNLNGLELCRQVRQREMDSYVYVIMLTATHTSKDSYFEAMDAGADDFLVQPCTPRDLEIRVRVAQRLWEFVTENRRLKQLLPICMYCKKVRTDKTYWQEVESYLETRGSLLSHGICPDCYEVRVRPEVNRFKGSKGL